jgi:hypothetical protein
MIRIKSNNQWSGGIAAHHAPNLLSEKIGFKYSRLDFFGIKAASTSMTFFQRYKL